MRFTDLHCDTLLKMFIRKEDDMYDVPEVSVDIKRMKKANQICQFFAMFLPTKEMYYKYKIKINDIKYVESLAAILKYNVDKYSDEIAMAYNMSDIEENRKNGKMSAVLTIEDSRLISNNMERIDRVYDLGVRLMTLTWNFENCFGYPNSKNKEIMNLPLKKFGVEAVKYMQEKGIIVDASHLNDGGFYTLLEICDKPFVASHSNMRSITGHTRNLTDDMLKKLADKGGVSGINFASAFLCDRGDDVSKVDDMVLHIKKMRDVAGIDVIALGSDFDGISSKLEIDGPDKMHLLEERLLKNGFSSEDVEKIFYKNAHRVIRESMK